MFQENRYFRIWDYTTSHSTLIIRSEKQYSDVTYPSKYDPNNTIDIEFTDVKFISLPDSFHKIKIEKLGMKYIFNDNSEHFVVAHSCTVGISQWGHDEGKFSDLALKYDEILISF